MKKNVTPGPTPPEISVMQIDQDLKDGITKAEMAIKYSIKPWEVDEMFKHPFLKGRRPSRKKTLSFTFVDDAPMTDEQQVTNETRAEETIADLHQAVEKSGGEIITNPNQVTIEDVIETEHVTEEMNDSETDSWEDAEEEQEIEMDEDTFEL